VNDRPRINRILISIGAATALALPAAAAAATRDDQPPAQAAKRAAADELIVGFEQGADAADRARAARKVAATAREALVRGHGDAAVDRLELRAGAAEQRAIATLENDPAVAYAEPNWILTKAADSSDPYFTGGNLWGMYGDKSPTPYAGPSNAFGSQAAEAWADGYTGSEQVVVGVIDEGIMADNTVRTGVDSKWRTHPDLDGNVWTNPNDAKDGINNDGNRDRSGPVQYTDDVHGWDFVHNDNSVFDGNPPADYTTDEHGTHVAGTIGAEGTPVGTPGAQGVVGVNWDVQYVSGKFLGPNGGTTANAIRAVDYMTDLKGRGANVVATNNSWGGGGYSQGLHDAIIRGAKAGILFVAAAGNSGRDNNKRAHYPSNYSTTNGTSTESGAGYDAVIAVAAINSTGGRPSWSNYGRTTVDLGAPGNAINSTVPPDSSGTAYWSFSGTSMATPHVTGAAALYASRYPGATALQIRNAILGTTVFTSSLNGRVATNGRLNVSAALGRAP
jgi:subtilisin family serine protease